MEKEKYGTSWKEPPDLIPIGGQWLYAVGIIQDKNTSVRRVRVAKGKIKGYTKREENGELKAYPKDASDPISQPNRINIKSIDEWNKIDRVVKKWLATI
jgi:hypothetical protein